MIKSINLASVKRIEKMLKNMKKHRQWPKNYRSIPIKLFSLMKMVMIFPPLQLNLKLLIKSSLSCYRLFQKKEPGLITIDLMSRFTIKFIRITISILKLTKTSTPMST
jgi:hypothetical protein